MYIKHKINNIQTMKFIISPRQDYTTYFLFFTLFSTKQKKTEASVLNFQMAEKEGFEPPRDFHPLAVFKTDPFNRAWVFLHISYDAYYTS